MPSSTASSSTGTETVFAVSPAREGQRARRGRVVRPRRRRAVLGRVVHRDRMRRRAVERHREVKATHPCLPWPCAPATRMRTGPPTVCARRVRHATFRPPCISPPASVQARPPASVIVTSFQALAAFGVTVTVYRVPDPLTLAFPGATLKDADTGRLPSPGASLSVRSKVNAVPSCSEGNVLERGRQRLRTLLLLLRSAVGDRDLHRGTPCPRFRPAGRLPSATVNVSSSPSLSSTVDTVPAADVPPAGIAIDASDPWSPSSDVPRVVGQRNRHRLRERLRQRRRHRHGRALAHRVRRGRERDRDRGRGLPLARHRHRVGARIPLVLRRHHDDDRCSCPRPAPPARPGPRRSPSPAPSGGPRRRSG